MKKILTLIIIVFFSQNIFADENLEKKAREINKKIRCVVCQSQSIDDSDSILARDLRDLIKKKLQEGQSEKEITNYLVDRYGEFILFKPKLKFNTFFLWFAPIFIIVFGIFLMKGIFRKN
tara:strand:+ start:439 stop:798 length:360 start_codon:yes stop_codon:yes gene_type:complete